MQQIHWDIPLKALHICSFINARAISFSNQPKLKMRSVCNRYFHLFPQISIWIWLGLWQKIFNIYRCWTKPVCLQLWIYVVLLVETRLFIPASHFTGSIWFSFSTSFYLAQILFNPDKLPCLPKEHDSHTMFLSLYAVRAGKVCLALASH